METLSIGTVAFIDTITEGLVACRVLGIESRTAFATPPFVPSTDVRVTAIVTARNSRLFYKGETVTYASNFVIPRKAVRRTRMGTFVRPYVIG